MTGSGGFRFIRLCACRLAFADSTDSPLRRKRGSSSSRTCGNALTPPAPRLAQTVEEPLVVSDPRRIVGQRQLLRSELGHTLGGDAGESQLLCNASWASAYCPVNEQAEASNNSVNIEPEPTRRSHSIALLLHEEGPRLKSCRLPSQRCRAILWFGSTPGAPASNLCRGRNSPAARTAWPRSNWPRQSPPRPGRLSGSPARVD